MIIGEVKAAVNPFRFGFALMSWNCVTTCCLTEASQVSGVMLVGRLNSGLRSSNGSSMDGRVLKNSTPAEKSLIERPVFGSSRMPPGTEALMNRPSGPSSDMAKRMVKPPMPENENPPSTPTKKMRSATGVTRSKVSMTCPPSLSLTMPPIRVASISPPKRSPLTVTPREAMSTMGNLPSSSRPMSILMPSTAPANSSPPPVP